MNFELRMLFKRCTEVGRSPLDGPAMLLSIWTPDLNPEAARVLFLRLNVCGLLAIDVGAGDRVTTMEPSTNTSRAESMEITTPSTVTAVPTGIEGAVLSIVDAEHICVV